MNARVSGRIYTIGSINCLSSTVVFSNFGVSCIQEMWIMGSLMHRTWPKAACTSFHSTWEQGRPVTVALPAMKSVETTWWKSLLHCGYVDCNRHLGALKLVTGAKIFGSWLVGPPTKTPSMDAGLVCKSTTCARRVSSTSWVQAFSGSLQGISAINSREPRQGRMAHLLWPRRFLHCIYLPESIESSWKTSSTFFSTVIWLYAHWLRVNRLVLRFD